MYFKMKKLVAVILLMSMIFTNNAFFVLADGIEQMANEATVVNDIDKEIAKDNYLIEGSTSSEVESENESELFSDATYEEEPELDELVEEETQLEADVESDENIETDTEKKMKM